MIEIILHNEAFNPQFKYIWQSKADFLVLYGGGGSGKSENAADKVLLRMIKEKGHRFVNFRKVGKTIRVSQWLLLKDKLKRHGMQKMFDVKETDMSLVCKHNGNELLSIGLDDREKLKSLTEPTSFWVNEATELDKEDFQQVIMRLRGFSENYKQIIIDFNPIDEFHWLREWFFPPEVEAKVNQFGWAELIQEVKIDGKVEKVTTHIFHSTWRDNAFLSVKDKARYEMMKHIDPKYYDVYGKGLWGKVGNLVYPNGFKYIDREEYPKEVDEIVYGLDFGYTAPTSLSRYYIKKVDEENKNHWRVWIENLIYEEKMSLTDLKNRMKTLGIKPSETIYADSQDPAKIDSLNNEEDNGHYVFSVVPADKDVKNGIDFVRSCEIFSCEGNAHNKEVAAYRWKLDARGRAVDGEPIKYNDHAMDEMRYALYSHNLISSEELKMAFI